MQLLQVAKSLALWAVCLHFDGFVVFSEIGEPACNPLGLHRADLSAPVLELVILALLLPKPPHFRGLDSLHLSSSALRFPR